ncbi:uncharacterized protein LOC130901089 [Diorhabda carinulata]|uniref:uncharacterized protein LOC130901089 n=1 Tax=Diorhabda carinulata TaxID=1163345 RepID=UPI0025A2E09D|nr:uncharacterized protein LOC130901089 [Diorhabda carinulata]
MNKTNMLAAHKVKLHGITSSKWTTKDQIVQYKGLISLYTRDKKILEMDNILARKRQSKGLKQIQRNIEASRKELDNAIKGDKQKLRNTLAVNKELQLRFQNSPPQKVIDILNQVNFTKRKARDISRYKMKIKSEILTDLNLKYSEYEDQIKYEGVESLLPCEKTAYLITGKVQDAMLRKEAAIYIRNSYKEIIAIMRKDSIYFDALLDTLKYDGLKQGNCMLSATKLGQQATEYLEDRKEEYKFLERIVRTEMLKRKNDLALVQQNVQNFTENLKNLMRTDSDINLGRINIDESPSYTLLKEEISTIEGTMKMLMESFITSSVDQLYPLLIGQLHQKNTLLKWKEKNENIKEDLLFKNKTATTMYNKMMSTTLDTTASYNEKKIEFGNKIANKVAERKKLQLLINDRYQLMAKIRLSLKHLQLVSSLLQSDARKKISFSKYDDDMQLAIPGDDEVDHIKIIPDLLSKFAKLAHESKDLLSDTDTEKGYKQFEMYMRNLSKPIEVNVTPSEESLIDTVFIDNTVPTFDDIKKRSAEIVALGIAALEYKPPIPPKKKKYKFK